MFAKIFEQIFDSSIAENYTTRHVFMDLLVLADSEGAVDMTHQAISRRTNVPLEIVQSAITELLAPDPASRSPGNEGRRLEPLEASRQWGWRIINYSHYRSLLDEESRRAYFRDYRRRERAEKANVQRVQSVQKRSKRFKKVTHAEEEGDAEAKASQERERDADWPTRIKDAYPRKDSPMEVLALIHGILDQGEDPEDMFQKVQECAVFIKAAPNGHSNRFVPPAMTFFQKQLWHQPEVFADRWKAKDGNGRASEVPQPVPPKPASSPPPPKDWKRHYEADRDAPYRCPRPEKASDDDWCWNFLWSTDKETARSIIARANMEAQR